MAKVKVSREKHHPMSWSPARGWELLKRTDSYKQAVDEFIEEATNAGDEKSLMIFEKLSGGISYLNRIKARTTGIKYHKLLSDFYLEDYTIGDLIAPRRLASRKYEPDYTQPHLKKFLKWYGDIIRFPIDYRSERIDPLALKLCWAHQPFIVAPYRFLELNKRNEQTWLVSPFFKETERVSYHVIAINEDFTAHRISKEAQVYFQKYLADIKGKANRPRWGDTDFKEYLKIIDLINSYKTQGKVFGIRRLAKTFYPAKNKYEEDAIPKARAKLRYCRDTLLMLFHREKPLKSKYGKPGVAAMVKRLRSQGI